MFSPLLLIGMVIGGIVILGLFVILQNEGGVEIGKPVYRYDKKKYFMTRAEHECYDALVAAVGTEYFIFPQVHISAIVDHKVKGQNWKAAFSHINGKSVDFVLCDKTYISPVLAIELDDRTHERPERQGRDVEVERILHDAGLPLLRLGNNGSFRPDEIAQKVKDALGRK